MKREKVSSSKMPSIGYDDKAQALEVGFSSGSVMQYSRASSWLSGQFLRGSYLGGVK